MPVETLTVVSAPAVPPAITRKTPAKVIINLETREVRKRLADGVEYTFWTFAARCRVRCSACARVTRWSST
jgi:nitrite reductase (NO-forming)